MSIDVLLLWPPLGHVPGLDFDVERAIRFWGHFAIGLPTLMAGAFLIAPTLVWLADRLLSPLAAKVARVTPELLRQQVGGAPWRAGGTAAALMVGPAVLVVMYTQGRSGLGGWRLPDNFPDVFLYDRNGIGPDAVDAIAAAEGVRRLPDGSADISPIGYIHPRLGDGFFAIAGAAFAPDQTMFIAVDPTRIFDMMDLEFSQGSPDAAALALEDGFAATTDDGRTIYGGFDGDAFVQLDGTRLPISRIVDRQPQPFLLITKEFNQLRGTSLGDDFVLRKPGEGVLGRLRGEPVNFTVAGVVRSPGIDLMVGTFDLSRQFEGQSAASVFGSLKDAREFFGLRDVFLVAANLEIGVEKDVLVNRIADQLGGRGLMISDVRQLKYDIETALGRLLHVAGVVAWAALAVASLGVANAVMAGVRSRRYQLGVLRAVGVTRGEIARMVLAEGVLLGLAAAALGTCVGLLLAMNARQMQSWTVGYVPELQVAWDVVLLGAAVTVFVSLAASLWPARSASREPVLNLLQAGRAGT